MRLFVLGVVIGGIAVISVVAAWSDGGATQSGATVPTASPTARASSAGAGQVTTIDGALAQAKLSGKPVSVTLTFSDRDLTTSAQAYFPQNLSGATLTDPVVHLRTGQLVLDMSATVSIIRTTAEAVASVGVRNGRPAATVTSATIAGASVPQSTSDQVAGQLNSALAAGLPAKFIVSAITISTGVMTVTGVANP